MECSTSSSITLNRKPIREWFARCLVVELNALSTLCKYYFQIDSHAKLLYSFGACVGYAIIIADELQLCLSHFFQNSLSSTFSFLISKNLPFLPFSNLQTANSFSSS